MNGVLKFPDILTVTGYKGVGKDAVTEILMRLYADNGIEAVIISTGDLGRERISRGDLFGKRLAELHNQGKFYPAYIADALVVTKMGDMLSEKKKFLLIGGPRSHKQCVTLKEWSDDGFFGQVKCIEVTASQELRTERLIERTKTDMRTDLSYDNQPGVLDLSKLRNADAEYGKDREEIVRFLTAAGMYMQVINEGSLSDLQNKVRGLFVT